jgi:hypothetical protein
VKEAELKAKRVARAAAQEQQYIRRSRDPGFRTASSKPVDCVVGRKGGILEIVDCKFTDSDSFVISYKDIIKGIDECKKWERNGFHAHFIVDMWFPRRKRRRKVLLTDDDYGYSVRVWIAGSKIMSKRVMRGGT